MSESKTIFAVDSFIGKDAIVAIKTKGMSIISKSVEMFNGIFDKADEIVSFGKAINESGMQMYLSLDMKDIFMSILRTGTGSQEKHDGTVVLKNLPAVIWKQRFQLLFWTYIHYYTE